jgi:hypothetical protein
MVLPQLDRHVLMPGSYRSVDHPKKIPEADQHPIQTSFSALSLLGMHMLLTARFLLSARKQEKISPLANAVPE